MLADDVRAYLTVRRAAGFEIRRVERFLVSFAQFAGERGETHVRARTALEWAGLAKATTQWHYRIRAVINFARYMRAEDHRHEIPPNDVFVRRHRRPRPFIFTPAEICNIVEQAARLGPEGSLRPYTYSTIFALLAATGLRIGEALALRLDDITIDGLLIRETKFKRNRLVPLHKTTLAGLQRYLAMRSCVASTDDHVFVTPRGNKISYAAVFFTFRKVISMIGLEPRLGSRPRLHSFRHTFAVRAFENCYDSRSAVARHALALSTYLGHSSVASTYWYLEITPDLLTNISDETAVFFREDCR